MAQLEIKSYSGAIHDIDEKGIITKAVAVFDVKDDKGDISLKGSFNKSINDGLKRLKWYLNHDQTILLGAPLEAVANDTHLITKSKINLNKQVGRDTYEDYKIYAETGRTLEHSIGAYAIKANKDASGTRNVMEWKWMEYSTLTNWGASQDTPMFSLKNSEYSVEETIEFLEMCCKKANYSDVKGKQIEYQVAVLKALVLEPSNDTLVIEPQAVIDYKSIINSFKIS